MPLAEGTRLGPYEIVAKIGGGGMGEVYRARDTRLDRPVAIKFLYSEFADDNARRRFQQEAKTASSLNHPHILTVFEAGELEQRQYLVSEFVDGGTLREWNNHAKPGWRQIVELLVGVADGLACAHAAGITHRDVKPDNVLVSKNGYAKLADFGLAKLQDRSSPEAVTRTVAQNLTRPGTVVGTIAYMSPEQASGAPLDGRGDIFSFGVVLYELLAGQRPFTGPTDLEVLQAVLHRPAKQLADVRPDLPVALCMLVDKALQKDPAERYQTMPDLVVDLRRLARRSEEQPVPIPPRAPYSRKWIAATVILIMLCMGAWFMRSHIRPAAELPQIRSIAVLPLRNLSRDPDQEFFSDGTTEALISGLSQIRALKVISRTSIMRYKGIAKAIPDIGRELGVDAILEGSVQRAGDRVRITAQLIHASTDAHLWAQEYDRNVADLLAVQGEVARAIAQEIRVQVTPDERSQLSSSRPIGAAAQDAYLLGRYHSWRLNEHDLKLAIDHFERAIQLEPSFAAAYAGLSRAWHERGVWGGVRFRESEAPARAAALKALELDPKLSEAHTQIADLKYTYDWDWTGAQQEFEKALQLNPNSLEGRSYHATFLMAMGRFSEAIAEVERAAALDPLSSQIQSSFGRILFRARQYQQAIPHFRRAIELDSQNFGAYTRLADVYIAMRKLPEALDALEQSMKLPGARIAKPLALGRIYALLGRRDDALAVLRRTQQAGAAGGAGAQSTALLYFAVGDKEEGFKWLKKAFDERNLVTFIKFDPNFDSVRSDARFQQLIAMLHIPDPH